MYVLYLEIWKNRVNNYFIFLFSGFRTFGGGLSRVKIQICGISITDVENRSPHQFGIYQKLEIDGTFSSESSHLTMPVGLKMDLSPITEFSYVEVSNSRKKFILNQIETNVFSAALYTRLYETQ